MTWHIAAVVALVWIVLFRALLVSARVVPPTCRDCGRALERRRMGDPVCSCHQA